MARAGKPADETPPADWVPTQAVEDPILNGPYEEPKEHWTYQGGVPHRIPQRRPASYWFKSQKVGESQQGLFAEEDRDDLPLVNRLRDDVRRWRESGYRGVSPVTRDLFRHWFSAERSRRLFFCQREAVETIVYLLELAIPGRLPSTGFKKFELEPDQLACLLKGDKPSFSSEQTEQWPRLVDAPVDRSLLPLRRLGCKMATGSGKTVVMAMLIAWAFCNRGRNPASTSFPNGVLICAPNLTIKRRLQVLRPDPPDGAVSYYEQFDLVPAKYRELLAAGKVLVTNWHGFKPKSEHKEGDATYAVVNKGEETNDAFTIDRLGQDLADRLPILVLNDEGHHCWRPKTGETKVEGESAEEKKAIEEEIDEARVWLAGLDRINNSGLTGKGVPSILATVDLSATPFYLGASGYLEGSPFPWLVSDFGLVDAIESGIVKIPRLPVLDDTKKKDDAGRPDPKYFRLWKHITDNLKPKDRVGKRPKPEAVYREAEGALLTLAGQWRLRAKQIAEADPAGQPVPPVLIVVCDNTEVAREIFQAISGERQEEYEDDEGKTRSRTVYDQSKVFPEFQNEEGVRRTIRIDSKLLAKIETEEGESKDEAAKALRDLIDTVGKPGQPGEQVRCVVSVAMLTEGWDANNVTHVLGLRAFGSQLLCEQVVGRGLRRMSYDVNPQTKRLEPEYVDVYGIPFSLVPFKGRKAAETTSDRPQNRVFAVPDKAHHRIDMPVVEGYHYDLKSSGIRCDVDSLEGFVVDDEPTKVYLSAPRGYEDEGAVVNHGDFVEQTRDAYYQTTRMQQIEFRLAQLITEELVRGGTGPRAEEMKKSLHARHLLFPELMRIVRQYIARKVTFAKGVDPRELGMEKYARLLRERVTAGILPAAASKEAPLLPIVNTYHPTVSTEGVEDQTRLPVYRLEKSHLNAAPLRSQGKDGGIGERAAIDVLEDMESVESFTPNHRKIGFLIPYDHDGETRHYEPDFIVKLRGGVHVLLEIKGGKGELHDEDLVNAKNAGARKWVAAVNNAGRWGRWEFEICRVLRELRGQLERHVPGAPMGQVLPFRRVEPKAGDHYRTCVPLTSLRAAAGGWSEHQSGLEGTSDESEEWVSWERPQGFERGMFVAKVVGKSMEPDVPDGAYCLFRPVGGGSLRGRKLLLWHNAINDPETGGQFTLKIYRGVRDGKVVLEPRNKDFPPIELAPEHEAAIGAVAELVEVIGERGRS